MSDIFSAQANAFRALMAGTGGVAVAAVGGVPPSQSRNHDDGVTHSCATCAGGEPCGGCGGNISRQSAAYQALGWGMAQSAGVTDPFWKAAIVAQTLRDAPARTKSADWNAIEGMVARVQDLVTVANQGGNANSALMRVMQLANADSQRLQQIGGAAGDGRLGGLLRAIDGDPALVGAWSFPMLAQWNPTFRQRLNAIDAPPSDEPYLPTDSEATDGAPMCCVDDFEYPVSGSVSPYEEPGASTAPGPGVGWQFDVKAVYNPEYPCVCECCEFRQYYTFLLTVNGAADDATHAYQKADCLKGPPKICAGSRDPEHRYKKGAIGSDGKLIEDQSDPCIYKYHETPTATVPYGKRFTMFWEFIGIIYDTCRDWSIRRKQTFSLWSSGSVSGNATGGVVTYSQEPPVDRPHGWKDHPDGTRTTY